MQKVFDSNNIDLNTEEELPTSLANFINKGITETDECFYFKDLATSYSEDLFDKTGNESFINKLYVDDFIDTTDNVKLLQIGISFVKSLGNMLESYNKPFCIILGYQDNMNSVDVRFHKIRLEEVKYLVEDIDTYLEDCILQCFVN